SADAGRVDVTAAAPATAPRRNVRRSISHDYDRCRMGRQVLTLNMYASNMYASGHRALDRRSLRPLSERGGETTHAWKIAVGIQWHEGVELHPRCGLIRYAARWLACSRGHRVV